MKRLSLAALALLAWCPVALAQLPESTGSATTDASLLTSGTLACAREPALTGDVTTSAGSCGTTLSAGNAGNLNSGTLAAARGGAGTVNGALKANGSGAVSQAACADLSNGATGCSTAYTTGTWTPAVTGASVAGTGQTYSVQVGSYEQIGRQVTARFTIAMSSVGTASGNLQVSLPVAAANVSNDFGGCFVYAYSLNSATASNFGIGGVIAPNASIATFLTNANTSQTALTVANLGAAGTLQAVCKYRSS